MLRRLGGGGSVFVRRHLVESALARGWEVTTFNDVPDPLPAYLDRPTKGISAEKERDVLEAWRARGHR